MKEILSERLIWVMEASWPANRSRPRSDASTSALYWISHHFPRISWVRCFKDIKSLADLTKSKLNMATSHECIKTAGYVPVDTTVLFDPKSIFPTDHHYKRDVCKTDTVRHVKVQTWSMNYYSLYIFTKVLVHEDFIMVKLSQILENLFLCNMAPDEIHCDYFLFYFCHKPFEIFICDMLKCSLRVQSTKELSSQVKWLSSYAGVSKVSHKIMSYVKASSFIQQLRDGEC